MLLVFGSVIFYIFFKSEMIVEVDETKISVKFFPLIWTERIYKKEDIAAISVETYNSLTRYGGWGLRYRSRKEMAINTAGNKGVLLTLHNGRKIMLGSKTADELADAINQMLNNKTGI
jgi:hypothetical protein